MVGRAILPAWTPKSLLANERSEETEKNPFETAESSNPQTAKKICNYKFFALKLFAEQLENILNKTAFVGILYTCDGFRCSFRVGRKVLLVVRFEQRNKVGLTTLLSARVRA